MNFIGHVLKENRIEMEINSELRNWEWFLLTRLALKHLAKMKLLQK